MRMTLIGETSFGLSDVKKTHDLFHCKFQEDCGDRNAYSNEETDEAETQVVVSQRLRFGHLKIFLSENTVVLNSKQPRIESALVTPHDVVIEEREKFRVPLQSESHLKEQRKIKKKK